MRKLIFALIVAGVLGVGPSPADAVPRHEHDLTTPNQVTHSIAGGLSLHAPCRAFVNFHQNVHVDVFLAGKNPHSLTATLIEGEC